MNQDGSVFPAAEQTLIHFCCHVADRLHHMSVKVYLPGMHSLHID